MRDDFDPAIHGRLAQQACKFLLFFRLEQKLISDRPIDDVVKSNAVVGVERSFGLGHVGPPVEEEPYYILC
jgi:hypothetical protein